ncbi:MAG: MgtC/SapB family protein, partial [Gammaproteobacteria bacterium]|nr:MgtC/SapB family protein [Gammaproteobacteria bacterium]
MDIDITINLLVALAVGAILGLEREWKAQTSADPKLDAGLRTFAVVGLLGGVSVIISRNISPLFSPALLLGLAGVVYVSYKLNATKSGDYGTTSEVSLLLVFALGALAGIGYKIESLAFAAITAAILRFKTELHGYVRGLEKTELDATIQLLLIAIVAIPLLPNTQLGPGGAINPRTIGLLVLLIAGVSYLGYFATRIFGSRIGLLLTAALGGLTSSTAVTVAFSRLKSHNKEISTPLIGAGISLSAAMMGPRLIAEV